MSVFARLLAFNRSRLARTPLRTRSGAIAFAALALVLVFTCMIPARATSMFASTTLTATARIAPARLYNLDFHSGTIAVYDLVAGHARLLNRIRPGHGIAVGLAVDKRGHIFTTVSSPDGNPCRACVEIFSGEGVLLEQLPAPILPNAPNAPQLTDLSVDGNDNVYVSDYGQQAVYYYSHTGNLWTGPTIVVQQSQNAASVLATPNGNDVFVSGGCGFASARPYVRTQNGFAPGSCFMFGTIALYGAATGDDQEIFTPVDGGFGLVSISTPSGKSLAFSVPDRLGQIGGIALQPGGAVAYVSDHHGERIFAFARPSGGWLSGKSPKLIATYDGFNNIDVIAIRPD